MSAAHFAYSGLRHVDAIPDAPALDARGLSVAHPGAAALALHAVDLRVLAGMRVALVGPNGAGKSTLLKAAAGLLPVGSGSLRIYGQPVGACHHRIAYLPQRGEIDWQFPISVRRLVLTGRYVHLGWLKRPGRTDWAIVDEMLGELGLAQVAERQIGQLSGGQQQRALLARALAQDADLLLLDEPLNAVDAETRTVVSDVLASLRSKGKAAIVATHDLGRLEADFDSAMYLNEGREVQPPPGAFSGVSVSAGVA